MHAKRVDIDGIARPGHRRTVGGYLDAREPVDGTLRRMRSGQPLRIQQHRIRADSAQGLVNAHDPPFEIGCIDFETNFAGICPVFGRRDRHRGGARSWAGACVRGGEGGGRAIDRHGYQNLLHRITFCTLLLIAYQRLTRFSGGRYILSPSLTPNASWKEA